MTNPNEEARKIIGGLPISGDNGEEVLEDLIKDIAEVLGVKDSKITELEGLLSQDTGEWKSAAFQKIKELEKENEVLREQNLMMNQESVRLEKEVTETDRRAREEEAEEWRRFWKKNSRYQAERARIIEECAETADSVVIELPDGGSYYATKVGYAIRASIKEKK